MGELNLAEKRRLAGVSHNYRRTKSARRTTVALKAWLAEPRYRAWLHERGIDPARVIGVWKISTYSPNGRLFLVETSIDVLNDVADPSLGCHTAMFIGEPMLKSDLLAFWPTEVSS